MPGLYFASTQDRAGKTLCACSIGLLLQKQGYKVGYFKPVGTELKRVEAGNGDTDALIVQEVLGQDAQPEVLTPVMLPEVWQALAPCAEGACRDLSMNAIRKSYAELSQGNDLMLVSGARDFPYAGSFAGADGMSVVNELDLKVLLVERYDNGINYDALILLKKTLGKRLLGAVLNDVPREHLEVCSRSLIPYLRSHDLNIFGLIPHEPKLNIIRCMDLAYALHGRIVAGNRNASGGVSGFLIGTMQVENFMLHLRLSGNCAVIVGGDRTDLQLAALHGKTDCLILTGNLTPNELVRAKAEEVGVPVIVVKEDTYMVARRMSRILKAQKIRELAQIRSGTELVSRHMDLKKLLKHWIDGGKDKKRRSGKRKEYKD